MYKRILIIAVVLFCSQIVLGSVQKTLTNNADWSDKTKQVFVYNRLRGNVFIDVDTSGTQTQAVITTSVTAADQSQADSVTVTVGDSGSNYAVTIDSTQNPPVVSPSDQLKSSATKALLSVSIIAVVTSIFGIQFSTKISSSSRGIIVLALVAAFGISLTSTQADVSQLRADVTIVIPYSSTYNFTINTFQGRPECHTYLYCTASPSSYVPPGAQGLMGYWVAEAVYTNGQLTTAWNDSSLCTGQWPGCPQGILCTANGIKKAAFFSDSVMETRFNYMTSSDFNERGSFAISGDLANFTKYEAWSCAHPKPVDNYNDYTTNQLNYFRFKIESGKLWMSDVSGGVPADASSITTWTVYRQVSLNDYYGKYFIAICQECASLVGCGATGSPAVCPCKCYAECKRLNGFGRYCPTNKRGITVVEDLELF